MQDQTPMATAELEKLQAEVEKLKAEVKKLNAETGKLYRETVLYPAVVAAGLMTAGGAAVALLIKLFSWAS
jgi:cell division protein FtsB